MRRSIASISVLTMVLLVGAPVRAGEKCFLFVFAAQAEPVKPASSHSFVTLIRAKGDGQDMRAWDLQEYTISWLPETGNIQALGRPAPGRNYDLASTLRWADRYGARITMWGPYEVDPELLVYIQRQIEQLESGQVAYRMLDSLTRPFALNCIHAVSDMVPGELLNHGRAYGEAASLILIGHLRRWIKNPDQTHDWLLPEVRLNGRPMQRGTFPK